MTNLIKQIQKRHGYTTLMPIQEKFSNYVQEKGWDCNLIISAPTTSGKTLIAETLIEEKVNSKMNPLILYVAPMKSLLHEKQREFSKYLSTSINICSNTAKLDPSRPNLLLVTHEILFEIIKTDLNTLKHTVFTIIDEVHLLASKTRGFALDVTLTLLKDIFKHMQFLLMSATISFGEQMQKWLKADFLEDKTRAVKLDIDVIISRNRNKDIPNMVKKILREDKSVVIFRRTKPDVHSLAKQLYEQGVFPPVKQEAKEKLEKKFLEIKNKTESHTSLEQYYLNGIGIHHKDIGKDYQKICEELFLDQIISVLICTTTLGLGINLPIDVVIISEPRLGQDKLTPSTFLQLAGRAGRTGYAESGKSVLFVGNERDRQYWLDVKNGKIQLDLPRSIKKESPEVISEYLLRLVNTGFFKELSHLNQVLENLFSTFLTPKSQLDLNELPDYLSGLSEMITESRFGDDLDTIEKELFELNLVKIRNSRLELTSLGRIALIFKLEPRCVSEIDNFLINPHFKTLAIHEVIVKIVTTLDIKVTRSPLDEKKMYDIHTYQAFKNNHIPLEVYFPTEKPGKISFSAVACAMLFRWIKSEDIVKLCNEFGIWESSFKYLKNHISRLLEAFSRIILLEKDDLELFSLLYVYSKQIFNGIEDILVPLVEIPYIGKKRALKIHERLYGYDKIPIIEKVEELLKDVDLYDFHIPEIIKVWNPKASPIEQIQIRYQREFEMTKIIKQILDNEETRDFECKSELRLIDNRRKKLLAKHVSAFANASGGFLLIGLTDDVPHEICGIRPSDYKREQFSQVIGSRIRPFFDDYDFHKIKIEQQRIIVLEIRSHTLSEPLTVDGRIPYRKDGESVYITSDQYYSLH